MKTPRSFQPQSKFTAVLILLAALLIQFAAPSAWAATRTWSGAAGNGNWNNSANWGAATPVAADTAQFTSASTAQTQVYMGTTGGKSITSISFSSGTTVNYNIRLADTPNGSSAANLTLSSGGTITVADGFSHTIGTGGFGSGSIGTLVLGGAYNVVTSSGNLTINSGTSGSFAITKTGGGNLTLSGTADNGGLGINANAGTVIFGKTSTTSVHNIGIASSIGSGGTIQFGGSGNYPMWSDLNLTINSGGVLDMNGISQDYSGQSGGTGTGLINVNGTGISSGGALINGNAGTTSTLTFVSGGIVLQANSSIGGAGNISVASGIISGNFTLTKVGAGTLTLAGKNTYTGFTTNNAGKFQGVTGGSCSASTNILNATTATNSISITDNTKGWTNGGFIAAAAGVLEFDFGVVTPSGTLAPYQVTNVAAFTVTPTVRVVLPGGTAPGTYPLMKWGSKTGTEPTTAQLTVVGVAGCTLSTVGNTLNIVVPVNVKANNSLDLTNSASWTIAVPGVSEIATWDNTVASANTVGLGGNTTWGGIQIKNPGGSVTITNSGGAMTLGAAATDIDMATATVDLTLNCNLTLGAANVWDVTSGRTLTVNGAITGANAITKQGVGTAVITNSANAYTGATTISAGTLRLGGNNAIPGGTGFGNVTNNGVLDLNTFSDTVNNLTGAGTVDTVAGGTPTLTLSNTASSTFSGIITNTAGTLSILKVGTSTLTLSGASGYAGTTTISNGVVKVQHATALGTSAGGTFVYGNTGGAATNPRLDLEGSITVTGEALTIQGNGDFFGALCSRSGNNTWAGPITIDLASTRIGAAVAGATLVLDGVIDSGANAYGVMFRSADTTATIILKGANTYLGDTTNFIGKLQLAGGNNRLPVAAKFCSGSGTSAAEFDLNGNNQEVAGLVLLGTTASVNTITNSSGTPGTLTVNTASGSPSTWAGGILGNLGLTKSGLDTLTLSGTLTYTGPTTVNAGKLVIPSTLTGTGAASLAANTTVTLNISGTSQWKPASLTLANPCTLDFNNVTNANSTVAAIVPAAPVGSVANVTVNVNSISGLVTPGNAYPLVSNVVATTGYSLGAQPSSFGISGHLDVSGGMLVYVVDSSADIWAGIDTVNPTFWDIGVSTNWIGKAIVNSPYGSFANNDYVIFDDTATPASPVTVDIQQAVTAGNIILANSSKAYLITNSSGTAGIEGSGTLTKSGSGTVTITSSNSFSGVTTINAGTINIQNTNALGSTAGGTTVGSSGVLQVQGGITFAAEPLTLVSGAAATQLQNVSGNNTWNGTVTTSGSGSAVRVSSDSGVLTLANTLSIASAGTQVAVQGNGSILITGQVTGPGALTSSSSGTGIRTISNPLNDYTNATTINGGTLQLGAAGVIPNGSGKGNVVASTGGKLDLNGFSETINGLSGSATVVDTVAGGTPVLTVGDNDATASFSGSITNSTGTLSLVKIGNGTQTLSGTSGYSGSTTVSNGILELLKPALISSTVVSVPTNGTLLFNPNGASWGGAALINPPINLNGGTLSNYTAGNFYTVLNNLNTGSVTVNNPSTIGMYQGLANGLTTSTAGGLYLDGGLKGSAPLTVNASLSGAPVALVLRTTNSTYSGTITVNGVASATTNIGSGLAVGSNGTQSPNLTNVVALPNASITVNGTMSLGYATMPDMSWAASGSLSQPGITGTTFAMDALNGPGVVVANFSIAGGTRTLSVGNNNGSGSFSGVIAAGVNSTLSLIKNGNGTQTLSGTNTYTGTTTIAGGTLTISGSGSLGGGVYAGNITNNGSFNFASSTSQTNSGVISGAGSLVNSGNLTLSGNNTYSGNTTISNGTLTVTATGRITNSATITVGTESGNTAVLNAAAGITIGAGKTLQGHGTVQGTATITGTLAPGNSSIGTLTKTAAPVLNGTVAMEINAASSPNADKLVLTTGTLTYGGALTVNNLGGWPASGAGTVFDLFDAPAFAGNFSSVTLPSGGSLHWKTNGLTVDGSIMFTNTVPTAPNTNYNRTSGLQYVVRISDLMGLTSDADGDTVFYVGYTSTNSAVTNDATYIYIPANIGTEEFTYIVRDNFGGTNSGKVTINITGNVFGQGTPSIDTTGPNPVLGFAGIPGYSYTVQRAEDVNFTIGLTNIYTTIAPAGGLFQYTDATNAPLPSPAAYYRLRYNP